MECPKGSLIAFHGQLWHGAYPKKTPGLRVTISNYFRHSAIQPQDDIPNHFPRELADDCDDPETFKQLAGFGLPYQAQVLPVPKAGNRQSDLTARLSPVRADQAITLAMSTKRLDLSLRDCRLGLLRRI